VIHSFRATVSLTHKHRQNDDKSMALIAVARSLKWSSKAVRPRRFAIAKINDAGKSLEERQHSRVLESKKSSNLSKRDSAIKR